MFTVSEWIDGRKLEALAESVRRALGGIEAQVQAKWFAQHDRDGAHTAVTATSLTTGPFGLRAPFSHTTSVGASYITVPRTSRVIIHTAGVAALNDLQGLVMADAEEGDLILLQAMGSISLRIRRIQSATSAIPVNSSFRWDTGLVFSSWVELDNACAWAVYTRAVGGVSDVLDGSTFFWNLCGHFTVGT